MPLRCVILLLVSLLAACAQLPASAPAEGRLGPAIEAYNISGRVVLRQGERRDYLRFDWEHSTRGDDLLFATPLGQGMARLRRDATGAVLELADGGRHVAADWQALTRELLGAALPLDELPEWLRGARPAPQGERDGWRVKVLEATPYRQSRLPRVLEVSRDDVELRLIVDERNGGDD